MARSPQSQARRMLRRQTAALWGAVQLALLLCLFPLLRQQHFISDQVLVAGLLALSLVLGWLGVRAVDRLVGPTLDRLAQVAQATAPLDPSTGLRLPSLVSDSPRTALGQLASRLEDAQEGLRAQVAQLSRLNEELARTREELLRAERLAVVGRMAAGVAHEVGNPLGALIGFVGLAKGTEDAPTRAEALAGVEVQAQRIHRTLQELMDFSRAGKMELRAVALGPAVESALSLVKAHPRWRQMSVATDLPQLATTVQASEHHLIQVLVNLLLNSADACGGSGHVTIAARTEDGQTLGLTVADDGPGIAAGDEERIFEPFVSSKAVGEGTGLGLAISRQIVEAFGGTIRARRGGQGARFELALHRRPARAGEDPVRP